jgi:hypothetical protein
MTKAKNGVTKRFEGMILSIVHSSFARSAFGGQRCSAAFSRSRSDRSKVTLGRVRTSETSQMILIGHSSFVISSSLVIRHFADGTLRLSL